MNITRKHIISLLVFLLFAGIGAYWTHLGQALYRNEQRFYMNELINGQAMALERRLARSLSSTRIMAQAVRQYGGVFEGFEDYAAEVVNSIEAVANLQLAPGGVVRHIYPSEGHEKALGHNLLEGEHYREEAQAAIERRRLVLGGPAELIQGGTAVIGRNPVFLQDEQGERFWGFVSALIYLDDLLAATELHPQGLKGYSYELSRVDPETGRDITFSKSTTPLTRDSYTVLVNVPGNVWHLKMSRSTPTPKWRSTTGYIASLLAGLLMASIVFFLLKQPETLRRVVQEKTAALQKLAFHDPLTELANRRCLSEQLERVLREHKRYHQPAALMYLDLDDFKRVNDTMGHDAGDALLQQIAERLSGCVRSSDLVARLGGDEFGILLLDAQSVRDVSRVAEKVIAAIEQPVLLGNRSFVVSTSVGITLLPSDGDNVATLLSNADMAMYAAKRAGKRNFTFYNKALQTEALEKLKLEEDLEVAVAEEQFVLYYQPIITLGSGSVTCYEALIRWQHPERGLLSPDRFIGVAEATGRIREIGYWVIREGCRQIKRWEYRPQGGSRLAINLSPRQFRDPRLLDNIRQIIRDTGVDARMLEFEVTESCVMENVEDAIAIIGELKAMGITTAMDDFGTGYSSLALLKRLPVDRLKIDKSFIFDLETDLSDKKIVQGLITMAHTLQLAVVAEGIETAKQLQLLKKYGCDLGQGYLFSKPLPVVEFEARATMP